MQASLPHPDPRHPACLDPAAQDHRAAWIGRHQAYLWRYLRYLGADPELAEDLAQDCFVAALRCEVPALEPAPAAAWLRKTALNLFRMHLRRQGRRQELWADAGDLDAVYLEESGPDLGERYGEALELCMEQLAPRSQQALRLRFGQGQGRRELAAALGLSVEGVKTLLRRAKDQLRACIETRRDG